MRGIHPLQVRVSAITLGDGDPQGSDLLLSILDLPLEIISVTEGCDNLSISLRPSDGSLDLQLGDTLAERGDERRRLLGQVQQSISLQRHDVELTPEVG
ncbi:unnamed protein product [Phytophthora fragariaefolia]|uniref:Unnamed protein product n=1 Tax=Phytophthora fragariaefolia TaxID=1490495 RepID=A0A9W7CRY6_9STRA|nr:unnamed protein product [Phytophthora fragariaefolia]